jgi:hypothetical protein
VAANVTAEELAAQITGLEELLASGVRLWVAEHLAVDEADAGVRSARAAAGGE